MNLALQTRPSYVSEKLAALRSLLTEHHLDAYLVPSADEHLNEYLPELKQRRQWISGFTGSAGDLLVARSTAWLFVDSRYYEQADLEVAADLIQVVKLGLEGQKTLEEVLEELGRSANQTGTSYRLGFDPFTLVRSQFQTLEKRLAPFGVMLVPISGNLVDQVRFSPLTKPAPWTATEPLPNYADSTVFALPEDWTGESVGQKLQRLRQELQKTNADLLPITKLDQIAWLYNLRGWDIPYNPVFIAYAIVTPKQAFLFTNLSRLSADSQQGLNSLVMLRPYEEYEPTLRSLLTDNPSWRVLLAPNHTTMGTYTLLTQVVDTAQIQESSHPIERMKARKNAVEVAQMQQANLKASRAKTRTLKWVADQLIAGTQLTEADVAAAIERFYAEEVDFQGLSFNTIAATGANSSIVHYGIPNPEVVLRSGDLLLLDSGAQYAGGTTDDTRTIAIGTPTAKQIECYTAVLKAHINCAMQRFPKGATGAQLDGITRSTLWQDGLDYGHGTGHGVGAFLNVHEGPNGISKRVNQVLEPGMVTSVEPGYYEPGWGGIRIENLYVVRDQSSTQTASATGENDGSQTPWYGFESLTYIPFDPQLIDWKCLNDRQRDWLSAYNRAIVEKLAPTLTPAEVTWLKQVCSVGDAE